MKTPMRKLTIRKTTNTTMMTLSTIRIPDPRSTLKIQIAAMAATAQDPPTALATPTPLTAQDPQGLMDLTALTPTAPRATAQRAPTVPRAPTAPRAPIPTVLTAQENPTALATLTAHLGLSALTEASAPTATDLMEAMVDTQVMGMDTVDTEPSELILLLH